MEEAVQVLRRYAQYPVGSRKLLFTSNHDENTWNGTEYEKYGHAAKALAVLSCTFPGIPLIYSGQEKPNHQRLPFFEKAHIDWGSTNELHEFYKRILELRKQNLALQESASVLFLETNRNDCIIAYLCRRQQDKVLVIINLGREVYDVLINHLAISGSYLDLFTHESLAFNREMKVSLQPGGFKVLYEK